MSFNPARLKEIREARGMTQQDLASALRISQPAVFKYEAGTSTPATNTLSRLCLVLNVSADYLLDLRSDPLPLSHEEADLINQWRKAGALPSAINEALRAIDDFAKRTGKDNLPPPKRE